MWEARIGEGSSLGKPTDMKILNSFTIPAPSKTTDRNDEVDNMDAKIWRHYFHQCCRDGVAMYADKYLRR